MNPPRRFVFPIQLALAGAGLYVSIDLVRHQVDAKFGKGGDSGLCSALDVFSCDVAARSAFSEIGSLPVAVIAAGFYAALILLLGLGRFGGARGFGRVPEVVLGGSVGALVYSVFLLAVSLISLGKLCPLCMGLYLVNTGLFVTALFGSTTAGARTAAFRGLPSLWKRFESWLALALMGLAIFGFQTMYARQAKVTRAGSRALLPSAAAPVKLDLEDATVFGPRDAPLTVVEFSDFECPYCQELATALHQAAVAHGNVRIVFRHFPMDTVCNPAIQHKFHENACFAAQAAACADRQGLFWKFHDELFSHQKALSPDKILERAKAVGLDLETFESCLSDPASRERVMADISRGAALNLRGTPSWYVNGLAYVGARTVEDLLAIFERTVPGARKAPAGPAAPSSAKAADHHP